MAEALGDTIITGAPADPSDPAIVMRPAIVTKVVSASVVHAEIIGHGAFKLEPAVLTLRVGGGDPTVGQYIPKP